MNKTIFAFSIIIAFVAGTLVSGTLVFADKEDKKGKPFQAIWAAISQLQAQINDLESSSSGGSPTYYTAELTISTQYVDGNPTTLTAIALCNVGDSATGGGVKFTHPSLGHLVENQFPHTENGIPIGWTLEINDLDAHDGDTATVYAVCVHNS